MKLVVVDNNSDDIESLQRYVQTQNHSYELATPDDLANLDDRDADLVVLSGGYWYEDPTVFSEKYQREIEFARSSTIPTIGICLGMQIIVLAYGGEVVQLKRGHHGLEALQLTSDGKDVLSWSEQSKYYENHTMGVSRVPVAFTELANSSESSEIIIHKSKPIVGVQFHPEKIADSRRASEVWRDLVELAAR